MYSVTAVPKLRFCPTYFSMTRKQANGRFQKYLSAQGKFAASYSIGTR